MKTDKNYVKLDSRNRVTLPKAVTKELANLFTVHRKGMSIVLEPVMDVPEEERWIFDPKNREIVQKIRRALQQGAETSEYKKTNKKKKKLTSLEIDTRNLAFDRDEANER